MAEVTADKVCEKLKVDRPCRTHLDVLPAHAENKTSHHYLGSHLDCIEKDLAMDSSFASVSWQLLQILSMRSLN